MSRVAICEINENGLLALGWSADLYLRVGQSSKLDYTGIVEVLTSSDIDLLVQKLHALNDKGRFKDAYVLARRLTEVYPDILIFAYCEAVFCVEGDRRLAGLDQSARHASVVQRLKPLLKRLRSASPVLRSSIRNEYYWFSRQPHKQYLFGVRQVKRGDSAGYFSQGVGAIEMAKSHRAAGRTSHFLFWAKRAEVAWRELIAIDPDVPNSHLFLATALGFQGRLPEMEAAFARAAEVARRTLGWKVIRDLRKKILAVSR